MNLLRFPLLGLAPALVFAGVLRQPAQSEIRENAYRANNLGVALLEQYDYDGAAASFRKALERDSELTIARLNLAIAVFYSGNTEEALTLATGVAQRAPDLPNAHYVAGLAARGLNHLDEAAAAFQRVLKLDASDAGALINLGQVLSQQRQYSSAMPLFQEAMRVEPFNVTAAYGLATALTRSGAEEPAKDAMQKFEKLRDSAYAVTYAQRYLEQGRYGEAISSTGAESDLVDAAPPVVTFADVTAERLPPHRQRETAIVQSQPGGAVVLLDLEGDGDLDMFSTTNTGAAHVLFRNEAGSFSDVTERLGPAGDTPAHGAVSADYDNDGRPDLLLLRSGAFRLLHQRADGRFEDRADAAGVRRPKGVARSAAFVDVDHDGDLDIFSAGAGSGNAAGPNQLLRNNGNGTFTDITSAAGVDDGPGQAFAIAPTDFDNRRDVDLLIAGSGVAPRLFQNMRDGSFRDVAASVGLPQAGSYSSLAAGDINKDGYTDFFLGRLDSPGVFALSDGHARFTVRSGPDGASAAALAQFVDYDNDGLLDLVTASRREIRLFRNLGSRWQELTEQARLKSSATALSADIQSMAFGDLDRDGDLDAVLLLTSGEHRYWRNDPSAGAGSLLVRLAGRVSNRSGVGAKVELRAGSLRQRIEISAATPSVGPADLLFGLGARPAADVVRVIWPSGTLQAEIPGDAREITITELDRKPSSCPYLYTWNGSRFEFITDFMGGGEIGYWQGPGVWNTPDPDEYVRIPPGSLVSRAGRYELRVTNELEEALFVDKLQLVAIDHSNEVDVYPREGLGAPSSGLFNLATTREARPPAAALDEHGHDVLARLRALDRTYPDDFTLIGIRGYAEPHELRLDLGHVGADAVLLATGWTDYAFSADNVAAHHRGLKLIPPSLEAKTPSGEWRRVMPSIGIPVGRPQTVVIDLRGQLRPGERELRILTNMRIYWDQILVASGSASTERETRVDASSADLRWRGFSAESAPDGRQPFIFDYERVSRVSGWKTMTGRYTREGDVRDLLRQVDDMFVIAQPGDEIALSFDESAFPPRIPGTTRTFLLYADGYSKEMDIRSASPYTVEPLPFHAMTQYPYGSSERYPDTAAHRDYVARYNTRVVSRSLPPLETSARK